MDKKLMPSTNAQYSERELLIKHGEILKTICNNFDDLKKENEDSHLKLTDKLDKVTDDKVSKAIFFWVVGFIILSIMSLTAYTGNLKNDVIKNNTCLDNIEKKISHVNREMLIK